MHILAEANRAVLHTTAWAGAAAIYALLYTTMTMRTDKVKVYLLSAVAEATELLR
jgi:hypothetical protein